MRDANWGCQSPPRHSRTPGDWPIKTLGVPQSRLCGIPTLRMQVSICSPSWPHRNLPAPSSLRSANPTISCRKRGETAARRCECSPRVRQESAATCRRPLAPPSSLLETAASARTGPVGRGHRWVQGDRADRALSRRGSRAPFRRLQPQPDFQSVRNLPPLGGSLQRFLGRPLEVPPDGSVNAGRQGRTYPPARATSGRGHIATWSARVLSALRTS